jgi:hypothetical protein
MQCGVHESRQGNFEGCLASRLNNLSRTDDLLRISLKSITKILMAASIPFLFIVATTPSEFRKSSTQSLIRKHASKHADKIRRANFAIDRHNPRQLPPDTAQPQRRADHGVNPGNRETQPQHKLTELHLDETQNSNADVEDIGRPEKVPGFTDSIGSVAQISRTHKNTPSICQLGSNSSVLNRVYPVRLDLTTQSLLHRCKWLFPAHFYFAINKKFANAS